MELLDVHLLQDCYSDSTVSILLWTLYSLCDFSARKWYHHIVGQETETLPSRKSRVTQVHSSLPKTIATITRYQVLISNEILVVIKEAKNNGKSTYLHLMTSLILSNFLHLYFCNPCQPHTLAHNTVQIILNADCNFLSCVWIAIPCLGKPKSLLPPNCRFQDVKHNT